MQERNKGNLILRLKGLTAKECQTVDIVELAGCDDFILNLAGERFAITKIPGLWLKTLLTMVCATRNKEDCSHANAVGNVVFL